MGDATGAAAARAGVYRRPRPDRTEGPTIAASHERETAWLRGGLPSADRLAAWGFDAPRHQAWWASLDDAGRVAAAVGARHHDAVDVDDAIVKARLLEHQARRSDGSSAFGVTLQLVVVLLVAAGLLLAATDQPLAGGPLGFALFLAALLAARAARRRRLWVRVDELRQVVQVPRD